MVLQDADGNWVYRNSETGELLESEPPGWQKQDNHPWTMVQDPKTGKWVYQNTETGETQETPPDGCLKSTAFAFFFPYCLHGLRQCLSWRSSPRRCLSVVLPLPSCQ